MSTKKILLIAFGIIAVLGLVVAIFVGGIVWVAFSTIGKSEAAQTARTFLQNNEKLKSDIGEVREFGFWITGDIKSQNSDGVASLNLKVVGTKKTVPASVNLSYRNGREWVVVGASYRNDAGQTVNLIDAYDTQADDTQAENDPGKWDNTPPPGSANAAIAGFDEGGFRAHVLEAEEPVLVVFLSKFSLDGRELEKVLDELSEKYSERVSLVRYSVDEKPLTLKRFNIEKMPTVLLFHKGEEQERLTGKITESYLSRVLDKYLETE